MSTARSRALKGYKNKSYVWSKAIKQRKKTGYFKAKINGSGHTAGFNWGEAKKIDPHSQIRRYGKNSPSFDEGVWEYKQRSKERALQEKMK